MRDTFLFDLDGTLLPMDFQRFMEHYFYSVGEHFKDTLDPKDLMNKINEATKHTIITNDGRRNEEIFMEYFDKLIDGNTDDYMPRFMEFYDSGFSLCKKTTWQDENIIQAVKILKEKGYRVAIATNPLLPYKANLHRIRWAGFEPEEFEYISSFEENMYTKPHLEFYKEVMEKIDVTPEQCYMVGNDEIEDMVAAKLGIETYLIDDCLLNQGKAIVQADHRGTYKSFYDFVKKLEPINMKGAI